MLKKTVTYTNFDDEKVTEDLYFNLTKAELAEMHFGRQGGLKTFLEEIVKSGDDAEIVKAFKDILLKSIGKRVGGNFVKNQEVIDGFLYSAAYEVVFLELLTDAKASAEFISGVLPKDLTEQANTQMSVNLPQSPISLTPNLNTATPDFSRMTDADFAAWRLRQSSPLGPLGL